VSERSYGGVDRGGVGIGARAFVGFLAVGCGFGLGVFGCVGGFGGGLWALGIVVGGGCARMTSGVYWVGVEGLEV